MPCATATHKEKALRNGRASSVSEGRKASDIALRRHDAQRVECVKGALVRKVAEDSLPYEAGLRAGDVIVEINRQQLVLTVPLKGMPGVVEDREIRPVELCGDFDHGMTYAGHPVAAAVALKNIEIIEDEKLVERARELGPYFAEALSSLRDHPIVGETRSMGLIGAIELSNDKAKRGRFRSPGRVGTICRDHCFANGLIMRACWDTMVLAPPLIITKKEIDELVRLARVALDATYNAVKSEVV